MWHSKFISNALTFIFSFDHSKLVFANRENARVFFDIGTALYHIIVIPLSLITRRVTNEAFKNTILEALNTDGLFRGFARHPKDKENSDALIGFVVHLIYVNRNPMGFIALGLRAVSELCHKLFTQLIQGRFDAGFFIVINEYNKGHRIV